MDMSIPQDARVREHKLKISTGERNLGRVVNKSTTWGKLLEKIATPQIDVNHTLKQYLALPKPDQDRLKNVGFFVGGQCDNGIRQIASVRERWVVTLDVDECNPGHVFDLEAGDTDLAPYEFFVYSTRKHTKSKPRLRIIIPLAAACEAEAYHALSRIIAEKFDATMESVDPVSYRVTQLMYWPSVCRDADFYTFHNRGLLVEPAVILEGFGDWRDHTKLPRSERDESQFTAAGKKPEDPEKKDGLVGAFCRTYDVPAAIEEFLSDIYIDPIETAQGTRYTYAKGTTSHGAIVYDGGKFLFSNHMHDPASGHSQNAFDLVRIHLYGDLDKKAREGTSPMSMPSVKALTERLKEDDGVVREMRDKHYDFDTMFREPVDDEGAFEALGDDEPADKPKKAAPRDEEGELLGDEDWYEKLEVSDAGFIKPNLPNLRLIMLNDPRLDGCCCLNAFNQRVVFRRPFAGVKDLAHMKVGDKQNGDIWTDSHTNAVRFILESPRGKGKAGYGMKVADRDMEAAIDMVAVIQSFHPVREYLEAAEEMWDGKPRVEQVFIDYLGAKDPKFRAYYREIAKMVFVAGVTRVFEPGHKWDHVPIFEGLQGSGKSTLIEILGGGWYRVMNTALEDQNKAIEKMLGAWVLEIPELTQFRKSDTEKIKDFFSTAKETARLAFERRARQFLRQCIFFGSTNKKEYLKDETGNRRFWPVECTVDQVDFAKLRKNIGQIWGEAMAMYRAMRAAQPYGPLPLYLKDPKIAACAVAMQESRRIESPEEEMAREIENWLNAPCHPDDAAGKRGSDIGVFDDDVKKVYRTKTCNAEIFEKVLGIEPGDYRGKNSVQQQLGRAMTMVKSFTKSPVQCRYGDYGKQRIYIRVKQIEDDDEL